MAAKVEALAPDLEAYIARGMEMFDVPGVAVGIVTGDQLVYAKGFGSSRKGGGDPVDAASAVPDRLDDQGVPRHHACHRRRRGQARLGRPGGRPLPGLPAQGPVGHARVPGHRPDGAALRPAARGQRRGRPARLRPGGDDPVAASRRAGLELPQHLHLHQHHPHADRAHRGAGDGRRELGGAGRRRDLHAARDGRHLADRRGDRGGRGRHPGPPLDRGRLGRGAVHPGLPLRVRRRRGDQLERRRHGEVAAAAARQRQLRGQGDRVAGKPRGDQDGAGRPQRPARLRDGLGAAVDPERADHLAQRRHHLLRRLRRHPARQGHRDRGADQPDQCRHAGRHRGMGARPAARQPGGRLSGQGARRRAGRRGGGEGPLHPAGEPAAGVRRSMASRGATPIRASAR